MENQTQKNGTESVKIQTEQELNEIRKEKSKLSETEKSFLKTLAENQNFEMLFFMIESKAYQTSLDMVLLDWKQGFETAKKIHKK